MISRGSNNFMCLKIPSGSQLAIHWKVEFILAYIEYKLPTIVVFFLVCRCRCIGTNILSYLELLKY